MHACVLEMLATAMLSFFFVFSFLHAWHTRLLFDILPRLLLRRMLVLESCTYYFSVKRKESCTILSSEIVLRACLVTDTCTCCWDPGAAVRNEDFVSTKNTTPRVNRRTTRVHARGWHGMADGRAPCWCMRACMNGWKDACPLHIGLAILELV